MVVSGGGLLTSWIQRIVREAPTTLLLVATNIVPLIGVAFGGWRLGTVMVLYWLENGVIGVVTVPRIVLAGLGPPRPARARHEDQSERIDRLVRLLSVFARVPFFIVHYGTFWVVHGVFVFALFASSDAFGTPLAPTGRLGTSGIDPGAVATGFVALTLYHLVAFIYWDLIRGEARQSTASKVMFAPYPRLLVLHMTIIGGAFLVAETGQPIAALVLLVILKTGLDLGTQLKERGLLGSRPTIVTSSIPQDR